MVGTVLSGKFLDLRIVGIDGVIEGGVSRVEAVCLGP